MQGNTPYLDSGDYPVLEYPVLTGWFLELERILTRLLGGAQGLDLTGEQTGRLDVDLPGRQHRAAGRAVPDRGLGPGAHRRRPALGRDDAGRLALRRRRSLDQLGHAADRADRAGHAGLGPPPARAAGVLLGLGMAAKLYPLFLLGPLLLLCLRSGGCRDFA